MCIRDSINTFADHLSFQAIQNGTGNEITVKRNGTERIIIAGDRVINTIRAGVAVNNRDDGNAKGVGFLNSDGFLVGINDENQIRQATHFLDPAKGAFELFQLTGELERFLFRQGLDFLTTEAIFQGTKTADRL